jgi:hypothetical protein
MKFVLTRQHYDMKPDTIWFDAGPAIPSLWEGESRVVTAIEGDKTEGCFRIVPIDKLKVIESTTTQS